MVGTSVSVELESPLEVKKLWKAMVKDAHLFPQQVPGLSSAVTRLHGDGGVGTVIQIDFTPLNKDFSYVKERTEEIDEESFYHRYSYIEGGQLGTLWASAEFKLKMRGKAEGGSVVKFTCEYDTLPGVTVDEAQIKQIEGASLGLLKAIEAFVVQVERGEKLSRGSVLGKMVGTSVSVELDSPLEVKKLWKAMVKDADLFPQQVPGLSSAVTRLHGDGGVGTVIQIDFTPLNKDFSYVKERTEEIDEESFYHRYSYIEGGQLGTLWASAEFKLKMRGKAEGGSVVKFTCEYDTLPGVTVDEAQIKQMEGASLGLLKAIEAFVVQNPSLYP